MLQSLGAQVQGGSPRDPLPFPFSSLPHPLQRISQAIGRIQDIYNRPSLCTESATILGMRLVSLDAYDLAILDR
jgi:hypothetical protein